MNEKERADHADSRYKLLQSQNNQIEKVITDENQNDTNRPNNSSPEISPLETSVNIAKIWGK